MNELSREQKSAIEFVALLMEGMSNFASLLANIYNVMPDLNELINISDVIPYSADEWTVALSFKAEELREVK